MDAVITGFSRDYRRVFVVRKDGLASLAHTGFRCSGSMCRTLACTSGESRKLITAGRAPVHVADEVNDARETARPGTIYYRPHQDVRLDVIRAYAMDVDDVYLPGVFCDYRVLTLSARELMEALNLGQSDYQVGLTEDRAWVRVALDLTVLGRTVGSFQTLDNQVLALSPKGFWRRWNTPEGQGTFQAPVMV